MGFFTRNEGLRYPSETLTLKYAEFLQLVELVLELCKFSTGILREIALALWRFNGAHVSFLGPGASLAQLQLLACISNTICQSFVSVLNFFFPHFDENVSAITTSPSHP